MNYPLWKHLSDEHGLTLLESELHEIVLLARQCDREDSLWRYRCDRLTGLIARDFADILREWFNENYPPPLNLQKWEAMCLDNRTNLGSGCASHSYFDANIAMQEALEKNGIHVFGKNGDEAITDRVSEIWDKAWSLSKRKYLS